MCIGHREEVIPIPQPASALFLSCFTTVDVALDTEENYRRRYNGQIFGLNCQKALDFAHFVSAGIVSFARGLNDTP